MSTKSFTRTIVIYDKKAVKTIHSKNTNSENVFFGKRKNTSTSSSKPILKSIVNRYSK